MKFSPLALNPSKKTWMAWLAFFVVICVYAGVILHDHRSVVHHYRGAAISWQQGQPLYAADNATQEVKGKGFLYLPQSAVLFIPLAQLPIPLEEVLWRILSLGLFAIGLAKLANFARNDKNYFPLMTLLAIPLAFSSGRNGQMNAIMVALFMMAAASIGEEKWWQTSLFLVLSLALKPVAIVYVLLVGALYKPVRLPLFLSLVAMLILPFLTQYPSYVIQQYKACVGMFIASSDVGSTRTVYPHIFSFLTQIGFHISIIAQNIIRALVAVATLGLGFMVKKRCDAKTASLFIFSLATLYLVLFNPRTEYNSYVIIAPAIGYFIAQSFYAKSNKTKTIVLVLAYMGILFGDDIVQAIAHQHLTLLAPLSAMIFAAMFVSHVFKEFQVEARHSETSRPVPGGQQDLISG